MRYIQIVYIVLFCSSPLALKLDGEPTEQKNKEASSVLTRGPSVLKKGARIWNFIHESFIKEFGSVARLVWYRIIFGFDPHVYGLNPTTIPRAREAGQTAKVVLMLHSVGTHPSSFIPLAKKFSEAKVNNVYTVSFQQTHLNPVPVETLARRIDAITKRYLQQGYRNVDFALVGHSLGALVGSKYIWRGDCCGDHTKISLLISIGGRLRYLPSRFSWYSKNVKKEVEKTFAAIKKNPEKACLYTIWSDRDAIVPKASVHIQGNRRLEHTVKGWGHLGAIFSSDTHDQVVVWIKEWTGEAKKKPLPVTTSFLTVLPFRFRRLGFL